MNIAQKYLHTLVSNSHNVLIPTSDEDTNSELLKIMLLDQILFKSNRFRREELLSHSEFIAFSERNLNLNITYNFKQPYFSIPLTNNSNNRFVETINLEAIPHFYPQTYEMQRKDLNPDIPVEDYLVFLSHCLLHELGHVYHFAYADLIIQQNIRSLNLGDPFDEYHADLLVLAFYEKFELLDIYRSWAEKWNEDELRTYSSSDLRASYSVRPAKWAIENSAKLMTRDAERLESFKSSKFYLRN